MVLLFLYNIVHLLIYTIIHILTSLKNEDKEDEATFYLNL